MNTLAFTFESGIQLFFFAVGAIMFFGVVVTITTIVRGAKNATSKDYRPRTDGETARLCKTLDGDKLYDIACGLVDEEGIKKDSDKWVAYMSAAADKGYAPALREMGLYYRYKNLKRSLDYFKRAVEGGDDKAAAELSDIYRRGIKDNNGEVIIEKDIDKAMECLLPFAKEGSATAQKEIAYIYYVEKHDNENALKWYLKAAELGDAESAYQAGELYSFMDDDETKSKEMYLKAAEQGYADAECALGHYYNDIEEDPKQAVEWYKRADEHGDNYAACRLGEMYLNGEGVLADAGTAVKYFEKADKEGSLYGKYLLGKCYFDGTGVEQNYDKAIELYTQAAKYDSDAQYALGMCYLNGEGVKKNVGKAITYLNKATDYNDEAMYRLGEIYYHGELVKKDEEKARELWRKAARDDNKDAIESLKIYFGERVED
ncbi:MAG: sel1 repeat family protein [Clostridia bacterium]|nr:sel1 repeat family protein [Clostridia bacterium]